MKRVVIPELLDSDAGTAEEVQASLADLWRVNRYFGGIRTSLHLLKRVIETTGAEQLALLEVAAGSGEVASTLRHHMRRVGVRLSVTLLDRARNHLLPRAQQRFAAAPSFTARHQQPRVGDPGSHPAHGREGLPEAHVSNNNRLVVSNALTLPFRDRSFDVVHCGLFAHHLEPEEFVSFIREGLRVCRVAVLVNDLRRHPLHLALTYAGFPFFNSRITRHDGPVSVRRAYTPDELRDMLSTAGAARVEIKNEYLFRMGAIAWRTVIHAETRRRCNRE